MNCSISSISLFILYKGANTTIAASNGHLSKKSASAIPITPNLSQLKTRLTICSNSKAMFNHVYLSILIVVLIFLVLSSVFPLFIGWFDIATLRNNQSPITTTCVSLSITFVISCVFFTINLLWLFPLQRIP